MNEPTNDELQRGTWPLLASEVEGQVPQGAPAKLAAARKDYKEITTDLAKSYNWASGTNGDISKYIAEGDITPSEAERLDVVRESGIFDRIVVLYPLPWHNDYMVTTVLGVIDTSDGCRYFQLHPQSYSEPAAQQLEGRSTDSFRDCVGHLIIMIAASASVVVLAVFLSVLWLWCLVPTIIVAICCAFVMQRPLP